MAITPWEPPATPERAGEPPTEPQPPLQGPRRVRAGGTAGGGPEGTLAFDEGSVLGSGEDEPVVGRDDQAGDGQLVPPQHADAARIRRPHLWGQRDVSRAAPAREKGPGPASPRPGSPPAPGTHFSGDQALQPPLLLELGKKRGGSAEAAPAPREGAAAPARPPAHHVLLQPVADQIRRLRLLLLLLRRPFLLCGGDGA